MRRVRIARLGRAAALSAVAGILTLGGAGVASATPQNAGTSDQPVMSTMLGKFHGPFATKDACDYDRTEWQLFGGVQSDPNWRCVPGQGPGGAGAGFWWAEA